MSTTIPNVKAAKAVLRSHLEELFGASLRGVSGLAVGLDKMTRAPSLTVTTTSKAAASRARSMLPDKIEGLTVNVSQRASAIFD